jgi:allantoicase
MGDFTDRFDLASERLGGAVLFANDEFFADKENLLRPHAAVFREHVYTDRGKWMDGWETRRRRTPGHDYCLIRLGLAGIIRGVVVDTAFFRGNYPEHCSIEATAARADTPPEALLDPATHWVEILPRSPLEGDKKNLFSVSSPYRFTHLRFNIFPDGGVARLRVHGESVPALPRAFAGSVEIDVAAAENGAEVLSSSDMFFGVRHNLIMPGRALNMGDGWETKRRRGPGHDWALLALAAESTLHRIEVDTNHFKGNYPDTCMIEGVSLRPGDDLASPTLSWKEILPRTKLQAHTRHFFEEELTSRGPFSHVRLNIYPDGGVSRLRLFGLPSSEGRMAARLRGLNALPPAEAEAELRTCCGAPAWARKMATRRPFFDLERLLQASDAISGELGRDDWLAAFRAHPRIGERKAETPEGAVERRWARDEQAGVSRADAETIAALSEDNARYDEKFGHIFIICAAGKTASEMLEQLRSRLENSPERELLVAAEEQRKITRVRLTKLLST